MENGRRLNVALVFDDSLDSQDGVAQHVKTLGAWLSARGHNVSYLVGETQLKQWRGGDVFSLAKNLRVSFNGNKMSIPLPTRRSKITGALADGQFDVIHVMMPYSPFMAQRVIRLAPKSAAIIGTFHVYPSGPVAKIGTRLLKVISWPSLRRLSVFISVSQAAADFARQTYGINSEIIPNPVDVAAFASASRGTKPRPNTILFLGRLVKRKGCAQLLEAFAELKKKLPEAQLQIAGQGPLGGRLQARAKKLKIIQSVHFLGFVEEKAKPKVFAGAAVACFPSLYGESFGIVLVEAMASGTAVVLGGDNPGYRTILSEHPATLINPLDVNAFAEKLYRAFTDEKWRQQVHSWQTEAVKKYDIQTVGPQVEKAYDLAIARSAKNAHNISHE
jgi:phosphatidyl-myo-inositol alpha-mannosyltransferase